jgi:CTP:molybdopterin cytidylyltransferase MocA
MPASSAPTLQEIIPAVEAAATIPYLIIEVKAIPAPDTLLGLSTSLTAAVRAAHASRREAQALLAIEQGETAALALLHT